MRITEWTLIVLIPLALAARLCAGEDEQKAVEETLAAKCKELKAPGGLVSVTRPGQPPMEFAFGLADVEGKRPMTTDCHFRIASLSKVFVGTAVLILAGEGKLSLDDPISKYVADLPNGDKITLRHLGSHRSGLFNHIESRSVKERFAAEPTRWWTARELLEEPRKARPYFEPDRGHHYSNSNTIVLALVLEKVTDKPWDEVVRERVLVPLGLKNTVIPKDNKLPEPFCEGYAMGTKNGPFFRRGEVVHKVTETSPSWWGASGSIISTLGDLRQAIKPLATGKLLKPEQVKELHRWTKSELGDYEYGFHLEKSGGALGHVGDVPGYQTQMCYLPEQDATVVAMVNLYGWSVGGLPANRLARIAIEKCLLKK